MFMVMKKHVAHCNAALSYVLTTLELYGTEENDLSDTLAVLICGIVWYFHGT